VARFLRQSTPATLRVGPTLDFGGAALTAASLTAKLAKEGGAFGARSDATAIAHDADGYYSVALDATDTGTVGRLRVSITGPGLIPFNEDFVVLSGAVYDSLFGSAALSTLTASALLTTQMAESYNADGVAPTVAQALMGTLQRLTDFAMSGTTITVRRLDGSTTAMVLTTDSATAPTSSTRTG
jgi:hypothetical protein